MNAGYWGINTPAPSPLDETTLRWDLQCPQAPFKMEPNLPSRACLKLDPYLTPFSVPLHYRFLLGAFPDKPLLWKSSTLGLFLGNLTQYTPKTFCLAPSFTIWAWWPCLWVIPGDRGSPKPSPGCKFCRAGTVPFWAQEKPWHTWVIEWMRALPNSAFLFVTSLFTSF